MARKHRLSNKSIVNRIIFSLTKTDLIHQFARIVLPHTGTNQKTAETRRNVEVDRIDASGAARARADVVARYDYDASGNLIATTASQTSEILREMNIISLPRRLDQSEARQLLETRKGIFCHQFKQKNFLKRANQY